MTDAWRRRHLLAVAGTVAAAGCLDAIGSDASTDESGNSTDESDGTDGDETESTSGNGDGNESSDENESESESGGDESTVHGNYETIDVTVTTPEGDELGSVTAAIADTSELRYLGLSDTEELPEDRGMLFVYESVEERTFVMREMDFGIDIVYADADGEITEIHHAPAPEPGEDGEAEDHQYPGRGQYVLEVNYEWTADNDVSEGDVLEFELDE